LSHNIGDVFVEGGVTYEVIDVKTETKDDGSTVTVETMKLIES
jgi:hypothetical protein